MRFSIGRVIVVTAFLSLVAVFFSTMRMDTVHAEDINTTLASGYEAESVSENAAEAASMLVVQPSTADTYIRNGGSSGNTHGTQTSIWIKKAIEGFERRGILSFDFSALDDSAVIESAFLDLYYFNNSIGSDPIGQTVEVNRLTQPGWVEGEATWDDYMTGTPWTTAGGDFTTVDQATTVMPAAFGFVRWVVTEQVKHAQSNTSEIAHMLVKVSESAPLNSAARFYSKEFVTDPSQQPKLIINFTTNGVTTPPPAPVAKTGQTIEIETGDDGDLEEGVAWPNPRFTDNGNGTITDNLTDLIWDKDANRFGQRNWNSALSDCNNLADNGGDLTDGSVAGDWHLANRFELESLLHLGVRLPAVPDTLGTGLWSQGDPFNNVQFVQSAVYWSSTTVFTTPFAWVMIFANGTVGFSNKFISDKFVWCVRVGQ